MSKKTNTGLGRGLSSLLGGEKLEKQHPINRTLTPSEALVAVSEIELSKIIPNPLQPRVDFDDDKLNELAESIKILGVIQPITVISQSLGKYQIISGERRYRASKLAGQKTIPAYVKKDVEDTDGAKLELALVENIQRDDLDPIEIALSLKRLTEECSVTQEILSQRVGINRATIANFIRLLKLPPQVQLALKREAISVGHAKVLLSLGNERAIINLTNRIIEENLNVRQVEEIVKKANQGGRKNETVKRYKLNNSEEEVGKILSRYFQNKIRIKGGENGSGSVIIKYKNSTELESFLDVLRKNKL